MNLYGLWQGIIKMVSHHCDMYAFVIYSLFYLVKCLFLLYMLASYCRLHVIIGLAWLFMSPFRVNLYFAEVSIGLYCTFTFHTVHWVCIILYCYVKWDCYTGPRLLYLCGREVLEYKGITAFVYGSFFCNYQKIKQIQMQCRGNLHRSHLVQCPFRSAWSPLDPLCKSMHQRNSALRHEAETFNTCVH